MHDESSSVTARLLVLGPLAFLAGYTALRMGVPDAVPRLIKEDGALEYLQVLMYATAAMLRPARRGQVDLAFDPKRLLGSA